MNCRFRCVVFTLALACWFISHCCDGAEAAVLPPNEPPPPKVLPATPPVAIAKEAPESEPWRVLLSGTWELAAPGSTEFVPVAVPGYWNAVADWKVSVNWLEATYRREFTLPADKSGARLEFDSIRWGGEVLINGKSAGKHDLGYSGVAFDVSTLSRPGANRLEVKPAGWKSLERYPGGMTKIPVGAANWFGNKQGGIPGEVFLQLYDGAHIEPFRVVSRIAPARVQLSIPVTAASQAFSGVLAVQILSEDGLTAWSVVQRQPLQLKGGERRLFELKDLAIPGGPLWSVENPALLRARVWLEKEKAGGAVASVRDETFGLREVSTRNGRFILNGKPIALYGYSGVWVYNNFELMADRAALHAFQVGHFRRMNAVIFRSHQDPLPRKWLDLCDRYGILVACEFNNFPDQQIQPTGTIESPYDRPEFVTQFQREIAGLIQNRFNHPSIVIWSASNEGNGFGDWERANLVPLVKAQDPTRLVMLSADITPDIADQHNFAGNWWGSPGEFERIVQQMASTYPDRLYGCTEYAQFEGASNWYGSRKKEISKERMEHDAAQLLLEQTEALRRLRCGMIMPMSVPIGKTVEWTPQAQYHALRNAYAPLGISIDYPARHASCGEKVQIPVWMMSDADEAQGAVRARLLLLSKHPGFGWDGRTEGLELLAETETTVQLAPWQALRQELTLELPEHTGEATLVAVLSLEPGGTTQAISFRPLRLYPGLPAAAKKLTVAVLEKGDELASWLQKRGHAVRPILAAETPDVIIIGDGMLQDAELRQYQFMIIRRVAAGARLLVLEQGAWNASLMTGKLLERVTTLAPRGTLQALFPQPEAEELLGSVGDYQRLNGLGGAAVRTVLDWAPSLEAAKRQSLALAGTDMQVGGTAEAAVEEPNPWKALMLGYSRGGKTPDTVLAYRTFGKGEVYACQLILTPRLLRESKAQYDPVAERLLARLIESGR